MRPIKTVVLKKGENEGKKWGLKAFVEKFYLFLSSKASIAERLHICFCAWYKYIDIVFPCNVNNDKKWVDWTTRRPFDNNNV